MSENAYANPGDVINWDDEVVVEDQNSFSVLPEGVVQYEITKFERARTKGSQKMAPSPMAKITLRIDNGQEQGIAFDNIVLNKRTIKRATFLFKSCGLLDPNMPAGESYSISDKWDRLVGQVGFCHIYVDEYNGRKSNKVDKYIFAPDQEEQKEMSAVINGIRIREAGGNPYAQQAPAPQQQWQQPQGQPQWNGNGGF